jgi:hypothetical protein
MAAINLPERGQPLDTEYLYAIVNQINSIENRLAVRQTSVSKVNANTDTTSNMKFFAITQPLTTTQATANVVETITIPYGINFKFPPVVTATIVNNSGSKYGDDVICTLRNITTSGATAVVRFNVAGAVNLSVNLIAIGIPQ